MIKSTKRILAIDVGSGYTKIVYDDMGTYEIREELTGFAKVEQTSSLTPESAEHVISFDGENYYAVGENSIYYSAKNHIRTDEYETIKFMTPFFIKKALNKLNAEGKEWDLIVTGISLAYMDKATDFKQYICETLEIEENKLAIIPQGVGAKYCFSEYGMSIQGSNQLLIKSYLGIDIGYNSTDYFHVVDNKLTGNKIIGEEQTGIVVLCNKIKEETERLIKEKTGDETSLSDAMIKQILAERKITFNNKTIDLSEYIDSQVKEYLSSMSKIIFDKFKNDMATIQKIVIFGGSGLLLKNNLDSVEGIFDKGFIIIPDKPQYYNAVGFALAGQVL